MEELKGPICDLRFLLNRGYREKRAVKFVSDKYRLSKKQRNFLVRSVFSKKEALEHKLRIIPISEAQGRVVVDGYNVLITIEAILKGEDLVLCDDGFVRDTSAIFGKHKITNVTIEAIDKIIETLKGKGIKASFIFDSRVSFSGKLCEIFRKKIKEQELNWKAKTSENVDYEISNTKGIICSSDRAIIRKAERVLDIPSYIAKSKILKLPTCKDIYAKL